MTKVQIHEIREDVEDDDGRVASGIPGLDELCEGGFERNSSVLIMGGPGSGKSTFLAQFIYAGSAFYDEPGIFLSLDESKEEILKHSLAFGWDFKTMEDEGKLAIINYKPHEVKKLSEEGGGLIWDTITEIGAKRVAIDSLTSYVTLFGNLYDAREAQLNLFEMVRKWKCTTLFSADAQKEGDVKTRHGMENLTDAVISLHHPRHDNVRMRAIEIFKMRGTNHSQKICPFDIVSNEGLIVYPNEDIFEKV
ncbi:MAG: ATPase domain-containing protein [Candidatus Micrarchaeota archaeon]